MNNKLNSLKQRITIEGHLLKIKPFTLEVMADIRDFFSTKEEPDGLKHLHKILAENDIRNAVKVLWHFLENKSDFKDLEDFCSIMSGCKGNDALKIYNPIIAALNDGKPDIEFGETDISKKKVMGSLLMIILAIIGLISMISWLIDMAVILWSLF